MDRLKKVMDYIKHSAPVTFTPYAAAKCELLYEALEEAGLCSGRKTASIASTIIVLLFYERDDRKTLQKDLCNVMNASYPTVMHLKEQSLKNRRIVNLIAELNSVLGPN